jgi:hypothetical protein
LNPVEAPIIEELDDQIGDLVAECTKTATNPSGTSLVDFWDELPEVDTNEEALVLTLEPLLSTDQAQCLAKCKALCEVLGCEVVFRAITWVFKGLLDTSLTGDDRQREIDGGLKILGSLPIDATLKAMVALVETHGKAFIPPPQPDVIISKRRRLF